MSRAAASIDSIARDGSSPQHTEHGSGSSPVEAGDDLIPKQTTSLKKRPPPGSV